MSKNKPYNIDIAFPSPEECHKIHRASKKAGFENRRAQAQYRGELWDLSFEEYEMLWTDELHSYAGTGKNTWTMIKFDQLKPWNKENTVLIQKRDLNNISENNVQWIK